MKKILFLSLVLLLSLVAKAENWDNVRSSGLYYYGSGRGATEKEAIDNALAELTGMIATHVSSDFKELTNETTTNGQIDHKSQVLNCVKTYSQATLNNVEKWTEKKGNEYVAYCYMKRSELEKIYTGRIKKAKDMMLAATESLERRKIDMALQYYYWAYSLLRSLQYPSEVTDDDGKILVNWIPIRINEILSDVSVSYENKEGDDVDLLFSYQGKPVSSLEYTYNDGRTECPGVWAKDGRGSLQMAQGYETDTYHLRIEYEFKGQARGDADVQSVLNVITPKVFPRASVIVKSKATAARVPSKAKSETGVNLKPKKSQTADNKEEYAKVAFKVIDAIKSKNLTEASAFFTFEGKEVFRELIGYGNGRVVGTPNLTFFKSANGKVVARGLQMSFTFNRGTKKSFVEDVVMTFNQEKQIENIAFGLGQIAENDILCKHAPGWKDETREMLMEFLESYKTAYCLKRLDYIRDIFADDAVIIIGNVTKRKTMQMGDHDRAISEGGQEVIQYNRYTKDDYLKNLERCFRRNEFINIRFSNNDIQWLEKYKDEEIFAIQIGQEYNSTSYADQGYLFLLVNMTNHDQPQIKIRTWQPNEVDMSKIYNAGDFYSE